MPLMLLTISRSRNYRGREGAGRTFAHKSQDVLLGMELTGPSLTTRRLKGRCVESPPQGMLHTPCELHFSSSPCLTFP